MSGLRKRPFAVIAVDGDTDKLMAELRLGAAEGIKGAALYDTVADCVADYEEIHDDHALTIVMTPYSGGVEVEDAVKQITRSAAARINRLAPHILTDNPYRSQLLLEEVIQSLEARV